MRADASVAAGGSGRAGAGLAAGAAAGRPWPGIGPAGSASADTAGAEAGPDTLSLNAVPQLVQRTLTSLPCSLAESSYCFVHFGQLNFMRGLNQLR
jgi:hypothetical protein